MITAPKRKSVVFATLGICLVAVAVALNVSWIVLNWGNLVLAILGVVFFLLIVALAAVMLYARQRMLWTEIASGA